MQVSKHIISSAIAVVCLCATPLSAQVVLNEACSKNLSILLDPNGDLTDWVELHNAGPTPIDLSNYYLSDDATDPMKWHLPSQLLAAGSFMLLYAEDGIPSNIHFTFRLQQQGEPLYLFDANGAIISSLTLPYLRGDHSFGSYQEGNGRYYIDSPTPGSSNSTTAYNGYAIAPYFDPPPRVRSSGSQITLVPANGTQVRYSVDGVPASSSSSIYTSPINANGSTVISAIALKDSLLPSEVVYASYIVEPDPDLPILSLSCHPDSLFDDTLGLYMLGPNADPIYPHFGANFWSEREIPVNVEFYSEAGSRQFQQLAGLRIHGGRVSRNQPQRPFRLTARGELGNGHFDHPMFTERPGVNRFKRLVLRNSGADFCLSNLRDGFWHQLALHQGLDVDVLAFRPAEVYVNGEHWGMMNIRERIDEDHLHDVYGADQDSVLIMEEENYSIQGDPLVFDALLQFIEQQDMSVGSNFQMVSDQLDMKSFMDYFILELFAGNADWPGNNLKFWKPSVSQGKWRYIMYDLDATMMSLGWIPLDFDGFNSILDNFSWSIHSRIFVNLLENPEFKRDFINRFADLMNTSFTKVSMNEEVNAIVNDFGSERLEHWLRWCWDANTWNLHVNEIIAGFIDIRQAAVRDQIESTFLLTDQVTLAFDVFPANGGSMEINTIAPSMPFVGVYFNGNPIDLVARPADGFVFDRWEYGNNEVSNDQIIQKNMTLDRSVTAIFKKDVEQLTVYPDPFTDHIDVGLELLRDDQAHIRIHDMAGRVVFDQVRNLVKGMNPLSMELGHLSHGSYVLHVRGDHVDRTARLQKL